MSESSKNYFWDDKCRCAIKAALAVQRPLLVRGEPGVGKSAIAKAAAEEREDYCFIGETITSRTEPNDLLWQYDGVRRLAEAQNCFCNPSSKENDAKNHENSDELGKSDSKIADTLHMSNFLSPGVLWWAFDCPTAIERYHESPGSAVPSGDELEKVKGQSDYGWVVLIDEIDKADSDVPNSLLEAFANKAFTPPYLGGTVKMNKTKPPLIIITTNHERELPPAFVRRCLVLNMAFPKKDENPVEWLKQRAKKHQDLQGVSDEYMTNAAELLLDHRGKGLHNPSLAEYIDLLKAVKELRVVARKDNSEFAELSRFFLQKNPLSDHGHG